MGWVQEFCEEQQSEERIGWFVRALILRWRSVCQPAGMPECPFCPLILRCWPEWAVEAMGEKRE